MRADRLTRWLLAVFFWHDCGVRSVSRGSTVVMHVTLMGDCLKRIRACKTQCGGGITYLEDGHHLGAEVFAVVLGHVAGVHGYGGELDHMRFYGWSWCFGCGYGEGAEGEEEGEEVVVAVVHGLSWDLNMGMC